jgi:molecular chaperone DnaK (HSP70)
VTLGSRRFRPVEQVKELIAAIRQHAHRPYAAGDRGALDRAVLTIPADWLPGDARRSRLVNAAEGAGFGAVELLWEAVAAVSAPLPGRPLGRGDLALVFDLGATFQATLVRVGDGDHEIVGHASVPDWGDREVDVQKVVEVVEYALAGCRELLSRLGIAPGRVDVVLPVGAGSRVPGLDLILERGLGVPVRRVDEPELVVVRGAAHWLTHSGSRAVRAQPSADRMMPLSFTIPGGTAHLLRWLVPTQQPYDEGTSLARIRLAGGAVWELTARTGGTLDQILVDDGSPFSTGEWLAISRH